MKCFECGTKCITLYWHQDRILGSYDFKARTKITMLILLVLVVIGNHSRLNCQSKSHSFIDSFYGPLYCLLS